MKWHWLTSCGMGGGGGGLCSMSLVYSWLIAEGSLSEGGLAGLTASTYFSTSSSCCASSLRCYVLEAAFFRSAVQLFRSFTYGMCFLGKEFPILFVSGSRLCNIEVQLVHCVSLPLWPCCCIPLLHGGLYPIQQTPFPSPLRLSSLDGSALLC